MFNPTRWNIRMLENVQSHKIELRMFENVQSNKIELRMPDYANATTSNSACLKMFNPTQLNPACLKLSNGTRVPTCRNGQRSARADLPIKQNVDWYGTKLTSKELRMMIPVQPHDHQTTITTNYHRTNWWRPGTQHAPRGHHSPRHVKRLRLEQFKSVEF